MDKVTEKCPYENFPIEIEEGVNNENDNKKEITVENKYDGVIHRDIKEYEK